MSGRGEDKSNHIQGDHERKQFSGGGQVESVTRLADTVDAYLYVLNHSLHRIHLDTFLFVGGPGVDALLTGTTSEDTKLDGLASFPPTIFSVIEPGAATVVGVVERE